jgi:hypothetical protein
VLIRIVNLTLWPNRRGNCKQETVNLGCKRPDRASVRGL